MENSAGALYGNGADPAGWPSTTTQIDGLSTVSTTAVISPSQPPITAPRVVSPRQYIDRISTGKLALAAMAKARPTMKAMFCFSKAMPSTMATTPSTSGGDLGDPQLVALVHPAAAEHAGIEVVADRRGAGQRQPRHHREDGGEGHRRDEAEQQVAAHRLGQPHRRHVGAAAQRGATGPVR